MALRPTKDEPPSVGRGGPGLDSLPLVRPVAAPPFSSPCPCLRPDYGRLCSEVVGGAYVCIGFHAAARGPPRALSGQDIRGPAARSCRRLTWGRTDGRDGVPKRRRKRKGERQTVQRNPTRRPSAAGMRFCPVTLGPVRHAHSRVLVLSSAMRRWGGRDGPAAFPASPCPLSHLEFAVQAPARQTARQPDYPEFHRAGAYPPNQGTTRALRKLAGRLRVRGYSQLPRQRGRMK